MSLSRNATGREFQRHGPATDKLLSPRFCNVFSGTLNIALSIYLLYACLVVSIHLSNILHITLAIGAIANIVLLCVRFTYATSVVSVCTFWPMISLASTTLIRPEPWRIGIATATQTPEFWPTQPIGRSESMKKSPSMHWCSRISSLSPLTLLTVGRRGTSESSITSSAIAGGKGNVDLYSALSWSHLWRAQVWHAFSRDLTVLPAHPAFIR